MSQNKQQISRIKVINSCLSNGGYWQKKKLIEKISEIDIDISERTLDYDISLMRHSQQLKYFAPIKFCKTNKGYYYSDLDYSIDKLPLTETDIKKLEIAATTLKQYQYIPLMNEFTTTIDKIIRVVNRAKQSNHESILDFIEFEKTPVSVGLQFMDTIINAIQNKKALKLTYQKFESKTADVHIIHPYFIKEYRNRWYVIALNDRKQEIRTYAFDRIKELEEAVDIYIKNTKIDIKQYLTHCIGINLEEEIVKKVILKFTYNEGKYIKTQSLHHSQKIISDNNSGLTIELNLIVNFELVGIILGYGKQVKVLEPQSLADKIVEIARDTIRQYR
ncbi:WYL domain-containing protein [Pedobacter sp. KR3-3]|uniref:WYL domain-containing protein n=1 Tax=Pedobacter albus TaxID=3113905 RepID=A0ABU7I3C8_9SPHI|nr:WYL domain-containing protein [Pedobacter sp. KR3-3]MEE1943965.1 WYL domain-containing protein [Pedobacter sp. KR3-3]